MFETYKKSWSSLFRNTQLFLPTIFEFIAIYLLFIVAINFLWFNSPPTEKSTNPITLMIEITKMATPTFVIFFILSFIITAFTKSIRLSYIKQVILNKKISLEKDLVTGIKNFKSLLLIKLLIFLLQAAITSLVFALLLILFVLLQFTSFTQSNSLELNGSVFIFFFLLAMLIIFLFTLNTYSALFLNNFKGKKAFLYSYKLFKNNKLEVLKTAIALILTFLAAILITYVTSLLFSQNILQDIISLLFSLILITWPETYIMSKYKTLKAPKS